MSKLDDVQAFINATNQITNPADLDGVMSALTRDMGFDHFALIHHVDLKPVDEARFSHMATGELIALSNYPDAWIEEYISDDLVSDDPILLASHKTNVGFSWTDVPRLIELSRSHVDKIERARRAGIGGGFTVPSHVPGEANGSCNFAVAPDRPLPEENFLMAQLVGSYAFLAARSIVINAQTGRVRKVRLSPRQLECIALAGRGKTDWEISRILGISDYTVKDYITQAMRSYGVSKRVQLVLRTIYDGHIALGDLLR